MCLPAVESLPVETGVSPAVSALERASLRGDGRRGLAVAVVRRSGENRRR